METRLNFADRRKTLFLTRTYNIRYVLGIYLRSYLPRLFYLFLVCVRRRTRFLGRNTLKLNLVYNRRIHPIRDSEQ